MTSTDNSNSRGSEHKYRMSIDTAPFGYAYHKIILDENGKPVDYKFLEINKTFEMLTGLNRENMLGRTLNTISTDLGDQKDAWVTFCGELALNGGVKNIERYSIELDKWYNIQLYSQEKYYFSAIFIDITEEKKREQELERFFSVNPDLLCIADTDGNFLKTNQAWSDILGYSSEDLKKKKFLDFIHPDDIEATKSAISALERQENVLGFVNRYKTKDGTYRFIEWRSHPEGNLIYAAARDITDRIIAEEELKSREVELLEAQRIAKMGRWDFDHIRNHLKWSETIYEIFELDPAEVQPSYEMFLSSIHPDDRDAVDKKWTDSLKKKNEYLIEHRILHGGNRIKWVVEKCRTEFDAEGNPVHSVGIVQDITERKVVEEALVLKMEELRRAYDEIKTLRGIVPICINCKKIRDDQGFWNQVEVYVREHTEAEFSHGLCPDCFEKTYPGFTSMKDKSRK